MKALYEVVRDLEHAYKKGQLTPSFLDTYADKHGERITALYALAARNCLTVQHESGRNDHLVREQRQMGTDPAAVARAQDDSSREMHRELRTARDDGRPYALRRPSKHAHFIRKTKD